MTNWAPDYTFRYKVRYVAAGFQHDFTVRRSATVTDGETEAGTVSVHVGSFFDALQARLSDDFAFLAASWALPNSNVFVPTTSVPELAAPGAIDYTEYSPKTRAQACTMSGRSATAFARLYFYGLIVSHELVGTIGGDGVISVSNLAGVATARTIANGQFRSGDGSGAIFYPRLTIKVNDDLERLIRRTAT
jgi:hypothetical protein